MSKSLALCSAGGNIAKHTDKRSRGCEGEVKEKNISEPVFKNEAKPSKKNTYNLELPGVKEKLKSDFLLFKSQLNFLFNLFHKLR